MLDTDMMSLFQKVSFWSALFICAISFALPSSAFAATASGSGSGASSAIADSACDPLYYESLAARGWLEAQREITQNQNIILKPDSVFEYTCFDRLLWETADHADEMLSETSAYGTPLSTTSMDQALESLVLTSLKSYVDNNFGYYPGLLGGHNAGLAIKHVVPANLSGSTAYSCDIMKRVWHAAKCINFVSDSGTDGFFTFEEYASSDDKRALPEACTAIGATWSNNLTAALTGAPWSNDPLNTYMSQISAPKCSGSSCKCSGSPIPTGLTVRGQSPGPTNYKEYVCIQPGCRYVPGKGCYAR